MSKVKDVAKYLVYAYEKQTETRFESSELKLQKLLYFAQRESLCLRGKVLFDASFEGWQHGPVITELRFYFEEGYEPLQNSEDSPLSEEEMYIIHNVIAEYGMYEPWYLANLTHNEISWKNSRIGLKNCEHGNRVMKVDDILEDAKRIRPYDHVFDMYIDEFEDYDEESAHV